MGAMKATPQLGSGAPATAASAPVTPAAMSVMTTPRRSANSSDGRGGEDGVLPALVEREASGIAAPRIAPIAAGPAPSRNARTRCVGAQPVEAVGAEEDEREGG